MKRLESLRAQLEALDKEILRQIESRHALVSEIKKIKDAQSLQKVQHAEYERKLAVLQEFASNDKLNKDDVERLYTLLHEIAIKWQQ